MTEIILLVSNKSDVLSYKKDMLSFLEAIALSPKKSFRWLRNYKTKGFSNNDCVSPTIDPVKVYNNFFNLKIKNASTVEESIIKYNIGLIPNNNYNIFDINNDNIQYYDVIFLDTRFDKPESIIVMETLNLSDYVETLIEEMSTEYLEPSVL